MWGLTGRAEELAVIAGVLTGGADYDGVAIAGRPGVGKSRLAREAAAAATRAGWVVRWIVGTVTAQKIPLGSFAQWTDGVDGNPLRLVREVISTMTSVPANERVLVAVDDAHLLDDLSAFVVHQLVLQGAATVIATIRAGEPVPGAVTALWKEGHLRRLELQPLSRPESDALLDTALGPPISADCYDRMWKFSRGNVLFLRHLVDEEISCGRLEKGVGIWQWHGKVSPSPSLIDLVELQIGAVSGDVREVVDLVVAAEPIQRTLLATLARPEMIEEAERRGLIAVSGASAKNTVRVAHPLYGEVRVAKCGSLRMSRLRGRIAAAMTRLEDPRPDDQLRLGLLWLDSDLEPNADVYLRAARVALKRLDLALTERLAQAAISAGAGPAADILRAHALVLLNRGADVEAVLDSLAGQSLSEPVASQVVALRAANLLWPLGRPADSWDVVEEALAQTRHSPGRYLHAYRSVQLALAGQPAQASAVLQTLDRSELEALPALVSIWAEVIALGDLGYPQRAAAAAAEGYRLAMDSTEAAYQGIGLTEFHVSALLFGGEIRQAVRAAQHSYQKFVNLPGIAGSVASAVSGMAALGAGDLVRALDCLGAAVTGLEDQGDTTGVLYRSMIAYTQALARCGHVDAARAAQQRMVEIRHPSSVFVESDRLLSTAWVAASRGWITTSRETAMQAADFARDHHQAAREVMCLQTAVQFGEATVADRVEALADQVGTARAALAARYANAIARGCGDELCTVSREFETMGDRLAAADTAAQAGLAYSHHKRRGAALSAYARAELIGRLCGGALSPAMQAIQAPPQLTTREREIGMLVAQGLANKEIAQALTMSVRTVEGHIYRVTAKLGVTNRTELSALFQDFGKIRTPSLGSVVMGAPIGVGAVVAMDPAAGSQ